MMSSDRLDADRKPDEVVGDAGGKPLFSGELLVRGGGRMNYEALRIAHVGEVREELDRVDEAAARLEPSFNAESENAP